MVNQLKESGERGLVEKLANLEAYMPGEDPIIYKFAQFLSECANNDFDSETFEIMATVILDEKNQFHDSYDLLVQSIPKMARLIFGEVDDSALDEGRDAVLAQALRSLGEGAE